MVKILYLSVFLILRCCARNVVRGRQPCQDLQPYAALSAEVRRLDSHA